MRIDNHAIADGPMQTAIIGFEAEEILAIMWAIEVATDELDDELAETAWAVHQRLQEAWKELLEAKSKANGN